MKIWKSLFQKLQPFPSAHLTFLQNIFPIFALLKMLQSVIFRSTTTFKLKHRIRVCELWISFCIDDVTEITRPADRSFVIGWPTTNVVATFKSFDLKETWLNKLTEQIQEERGKQVPKTLTLDIMNKEVDKVSATTNTL